MHMVGQIMELEDDDGERDDKAYADVVLDKEIVAVEEILMVLVEAAVEAVQVLKDKKDKVLLEETVVMDYNMQ